MEDKELTAIARAIIDSNIYVTIASAGADGLPWASPVFFATDDYFDFYWLSSPKTRHSQNIVANPHISLVIFDSKAPAGTGNAVAITATAEEVPAAEIERGLAVYPGAAERGGRPVAIERVQDPSPLRLYRARASEHFIQCPFGDEGKCLAHGERFDHRIAVAMP